MNKTELQELIAEKKAELRLLQKEVNKLLCVEWWLENPTLVSFETEWYSESNDDGTASPSWHFNNEIWADGLTYNQDPEEWDQRHDWIYDAGEYPGFEDLEDGTVVRNPNRLDIYKKILKIFWNFRETGISKF